MDFSYLLELAKNNDQNNKKEASVQKFSANVSAPKKLSHPGVKTAAVQAYLNKKEKDKQKQDEEFQKTRQNLLLLRSKDKKANKRVNAMINMTRGASKSVLDDAKDITTARGEDQCDADDYGYESAMSQQIFQKLVERYTHLPEDDRLKFVKTSKASIADVKNRVMSSLKKEEEEELEPRKRKRRSKETKEKGNGFINDGDEYDTSTKSVTTTSKTSKNCSKNQSEMKFPVNLNVTAYKSDKYDHFKYKTKDKIEQGQKGTSVKNKPALKSGTPKPMSFEELLKVAQTKQKEPDPLIGTDKKTVTEKVEEENRPLTAKEKEDIEEEKLRKLRRAGKLPPAEAKHKEETVKSLKETCKGEKNHQNELAILPGDKKSNSVKHVVKPDKPDKSKYFAIMSKPTDKKMSTPTSVKTNKPKPISPAPTSVNIDARSRHVSDFQKRPPQRPPQRPLPSGRSRPPPKLSHPNRLESDEDSEYDSDMDDFIDDGVDGIDYSSEIAKMFKYDKSKYRHIDDDDCDDMEASYSQVEREEKRSAKLGLMEDLEDIRREEQEEKRKRMLKKKR